MIDEFCEACGASAHSLSPREVEQTVTPLLARLAAAESEAARLRERVKLAETARASLLGRVDALAADLDVAERAEADAREQRARAEKAERERDEERVRARAAEALEAELRGVLRDLVERLRPDSREGWGIWADRARALLSRSGGAATARGGGT